MNCNERDNYRTRVLKLAAAALAASCLHEPQALRLRSDAEPWALNRPWEARLQPDRLVALRFDLDASVHALSIDCRPESGNVEISVYAPGNESFARGACKTIEVPQAKPGAWFVVVRAVGGPADVLVEARGTAVTGD